MKKCKKILPIVVVILLLLCCVSVNAQVNTEYNKNDWTAQYKLDISEHQLNKTFSANGVDEAKMNVVIKNKTTNILAEALSDIDVLIRSENSIAKPQKVIIFKGEAISEEISLTSTQPGVATVTAEAIGFEVATTSVEFAPPPVPCELLLTAFPNENILADGRHPTTLTVKLLNPDDELFIPQVDKSIDVWTNRGEILPQIKIPKEKFYGREEFSTYKEGIVNITARSPDFNLEGKTEATFISPVTLLTLIFAALGGFLAGIFKYYQEYKKGIVFLPKRQRDSTWRLGMLGHSIFHAVFGLIVYMGACLNMPLTNLFKLPIGIWSGALMIGVTGGLFFFAIISFWGLYIKSTS